MLDRLRKDHRRIALLADWLEAMMYDATTPPTGLDEMRHGLAREVLQHIAAEERMIFRPLRQAAPVWLESECPPHQGGDVFARFIEDHIAHWDSRRVAVDWRGYRIAARAMIAELRTRMLHEEARIYPQALARMASL